MCGAATANARLPTVDSRIGGTQDGLTPAVDRSVLVGATENAGVEIAGVGRTA